MLGLFNTSLVRPLIFKGTDPVAAVVSAFNHYRWDMTDTVSMTAVLGGSPSVNAPVVLILDKGPNGQHLMAPSDDSGPRYQSGGGVLFDGIDDRLQAGSFPNTGTNNTVFMVVETTDDKLILGATANNHHFGIADQGQNGVTANNSPYPAGTTYVNGGAAITDRGALHTALATGQPVVFEQDNINFGSVLNLTFGDSINIAGWDFAGVMKEIIVVTEALTSNQRDTIRNALATKHGVTLS